MSSGSLAFNGIELTDAQKEMFKPLGEVLIPEEKNQRFIDSINKQFETKSRVKAVRRSKTKKTQRKIKINLQETPFESFKNKQIEKLKTLVKADKTEKLREKIII